MSVPRRSVSQSVGSASIELHSAKDSRQASAAADSKAPSKRVVPFRVLTYNVNFGR
jgi:hypothetical protein